MKNLHKFETAMLCSPFKDRFSFLLQDEAERQLRWFKDVEKFYGSVEKSSLTKAQEINNRAVYVISKKRGHGKLTVDNSISLTLQRDQGQGQNLFYLRLTLPFSVNTEFCLQEDPWRLRKND